MNAHTINRSIAHTIVSTNVSAIDCPYERLHVCTSTRLHIYTSAHLHVCTPARGSARSSARSSARGSALSSTRSSTRSSTEALHEALPKAYPLVVAEALRAKGGYFQKRTELWLLLSVVIALSSRYLHICIILFILVDYLIKYNMWS